MAKFKNKSSQNVEDVRSPQATQMYNNREDSPWGQVDRSNGSVLSENISRQQVQTAKQLGLEGNLADLQNTANKMQARRRTRFTGQLTQYKNR